MHANDENIFQIRGSLSAPSVMIIGGTHGNERTGIAVVRQLQRDIASAKYTVIGGTLTLVLGNPAAIKQNVRAIDGRDLNRYFSSESLRNNDGNIEWNRATQIAELIRQSDVVIDLHATNKPSVPFVASKNDDAHRNVFRWFRPECVLVDPQYIFGGGVPVAIDEYADNQGKVGLCFETGWVEDESITPQVFESVVRYLVDVGILEGEKSIAPDIDAAVYKIAGLISRDDRVFTFADGRGKTSFEHIYANDVVGYHGDEAVVAENDGVIIFPKLPEHQFIGKPVCYLAKKIE